MQLLAAKNYKWAELEFKNAIRLKKDLLPAWRGLAQVEELNHHLQVLVPVLQTIVELDPKDVETKLKLARLTLYGGATDQALGLSIAFLMGDWKRKRSCAEGADTLS